MEAEWAAPVRARLPGATCLTDDRCMPSDGDLGEVRTRIEQARATLEWGLTGLRPALTTLRDSYRSVAAMLQGCGAQFLQEQLAKTECHR